METSRVYWYENRCEGNDMDINRAFSQSVAERCEVCGSDIHFFEAQKNKNRAMQICGSMECQNVLQKKTQMSDIAFDAYFKSHQQVIHQRNQRAELHKELRDNEIDENHFIYKAVSKDIGKEQASFLQVLLPTGHEKLLPADEDRVNEYIEHLNRQ